MLPQFLNSLSNWISIPLKSGLFFWLGGLMAWLYHSINWIAVHHRFTGVEPIPESLISENWQPVWRYLHDLKPEHATLLLFSVLFVMMLANALVTAITFPALRFLEGYGWWQSLCRLIIKTIDKRYYTPRTDEYHQLGNPAKLPPDKFARWRELENEQLTLLPVEDRLPTRLGNTLRSYERRPAQKYGMDALVCWPHLWLLLPENAQKQLSAARENLDEAVQIWLWSALFLIWITWTWWALPVAVILMFIAYHWALQAANTYGKLLETAFDLYRPLLYQALRFPLPDDPKTEKEAGENLTAYLLRGTKDGVRFAVKSGD